MSTATQYQFAIRNIVNSIVDEYARKHKPGAGQLGLFENPAERQKPLFSKKVDDEAGKWVTMRGARVFISGEDGRIMKGPKALMGKTKEQIERESAGKEGGGDRKPKPKPLNEMGKISGGRKENRQQKLFEELNPGFTFVDDGDEDGEEEDFKVVEPVAAPVAAEAPSSPAEKLTRPEWDQKVRDDIRSIMGEMDYDNADIDRMDGIDAIDRAVSFAYDSNRGYEDQISALNDKWIDSMPENLADEEPSFTLDSTPQPSPAKTPAFGNPDATPSTKQGALFDTGKNTKDLKGQELLFNSDAGDLNNPKTMENRVKQSAKEDDGPNDGDTNAEGLVFRDGRWHRDEDEQPVEQKPSLSDEETARLKKGFEKYVNGETDKMPLHGSAEEQEKQKNILQAARKMKMAQKNKPAQESPSSPADPEPQQEPVQQPEPQPEPQKSPSSYSGSFDPEKHGDYKSFLQLSRKIDSGELSFEEFQQAHKFYTENKEAFVGDLQKRYDAKTLRNIAGNLGDWQAIRGENKKNQNAESVYAAMMQRAFNVGEGISNIYSSDDIRSDGGMSGAAVRRLAGHVAKQTPESLAAHVEKEAKNIAEYAAANKANEEAAANPKTLKDFELAIKKVGSYEKLTTEQQETYDNLMSEKTRSGRDEVKKPTVVEAKVSGDHGGV